MKNKFSHRTALDDFYIEEELVSSRAPKARAKILKVNFYDMQVLYARAKLLRKSVKNNK